MGVLTLCETQGASEESAKAFGDIFLTVADQIERDIRKALATRLAQADWAPHAVVEVLMMDDIEIARPLLASSPVLQDEDMMRVLLEATLEHQIEVAMRPRLSGRVSDAIIDRGEPATLTALASNRTAQISGEGVRRLVEHSRRIAALRLPLTRHPGLTETLAEQMYQWVGIALRHSIASRFEIDEDRLAGLVEQAATDAMSLSDTANDSPERDEMERRLIDKLHAAGQLKPGYLVRAIREKRLGLFLHGLAALSGLPAADVRKALSDNSAEALYYACAAIGMDRAVFPAILAEIRHLNDGMPAGDGGSVWHRGQLSPSSALRSFRVLIPA
ncbi:MAG: hypothetical protein DCF29_20175 [Alphaproteobacteria bacterium]|nr:MAG: hypothetical protein DCF29_20175 [Alphaproteobacteria bacterium]